MFFLFVRFCQHTLEKIGANRDEIFGITGWFKGKDHKWRFEIPDHRDKMNLQPLALKENLGKVFRLEEIYDNPELYAAYPELRNVSIVAEKMKRKSYGYTNFEKNKIALNPFQIKKDLKEMQGTLVHEIQHMIQNYEDFATGGNPVDVYRVLRESIKSLKNAVAKIPEGTRLFKLSDRLIQAMIEGDTELIERLKPRLEEDIKKIPPEASMKYLRLRDSFENLKDTADFIQSQRGEKAYYYPEEGGEIESSAYRKAKEEAYNNLGGEQEARHVEERLDNREGTSTPHDEDALIVFGGEEYSMASTAFKNEKPPRRAKLKKILTKAKKRLRRLLKITTTYILQCTATT